MGASGDRARGRGWSARFAGWTVSGIVLAVGPASAPSQDRPAARAVAPKPGDDATFRPTVMVRCGSSVGSGTVIASVEGETLVLTASHVVEGAGPVHVELNRFNLGLERAGDVRGFPRKVAASVAARDPDSDLAILRVRGELAMPYIAQLARGEAPPAPGTAVMSIGFDGGGRPVGWPTRVRRVERLDMEKGGGDRPFLVTEDPPEPGRSGGGLFRADGALVGVCIGRAKFDRGRRIGLYTAPANVRELLRSDGALAAMVDRPEVRARPIAR